MGVRTEVVPISVALWKRAAVAVCVCAVLVGVPTDVIDTLLFTRMTPVRVWEYPVLVLTASLTGAWFLLAGRAAEREGPGSTVFGPSLLSALAVGCPLCNKIVVGLLGVSGALGLWAPVQPLLGTFSVMLLVGAVTVRWRRQRCAADRCTGPEPVREASIPAQP